MTAKNLYASNVTGISNCLERMNLAEPKARKWIQDKNWADHFDGSLKSSYNSFLDYLEQIRAFGPNHWKSLIVIGFPLVLKNTENYLKAAKPIETNDPSSDSDNVPDIHLESDVTATESEAMIEVPIEDSDLNDSDTVEYSSNDSRILYKTRPNNKKLPIVPLTLERISYNGNTDCVLTFGGVSSNNHRSAGFHVYRYLPSSNSWDLIGKMPAGRQYHSAVFFQQRIYVVGGLDPTCAQMVKLHKACDIALIYRFLETFERDVQLRSAAEEVVLRTEHAFWTSPFWNHHCAYANICHRR